MNQHDQQHQQAGGAGGTDDIDLLLRHAALEQRHIDDAGFTSAVMAQMPAAGKPALRRRVLTAFTVAALLFGLLAFGGVGFVWDAIHDMVAAGRVGAPQISVLVLALIFYWMLYTVLRAERE